MREIKFRAVPKDPDCPTSNRYYEVLVIDFDNNHASSVCDCGGVHWITLKFDSLVQFTGLHDKNGKEIYEGDIIQIAYDQTCIGQVVYEDGRFTATEFVNSSYLGQDDVESMGIEVIGNIHENPELLEDK